MKNLAGNADCDVFIRSELLLARIPIVDHPRTDHPDIKTTVSGQLGEFRFQRLWYYWQAVGPVPLVLAKQLYADPVGKKAIRVAGHCGCPPPEHPWVDHYAADGVQLVHDPDGKQLREVNEMLSSPSEYMREVAQSCLTKYRYVLDAFTVAARSVVSLYHIDSEEGLRIFADAVRKLG